MAENNGTLEAELRDLLKGSSDVLNQTQAAGKTAKKVLRQSKELDRQFSSIDMRALDKFSSLMQGRTRRKSKDFSDEDLQNAFEEFDKDQSGKIDRTELAQAIRNLEPGVTDAEINNMVILADTDGDEQIGFDEFKIVMTTKPEEH